MFLFWNISLEHDKQNNTCIKYSAPSLPYPKKDMKVYGNFLQELKEREPTSFKHHTPPPPTIPLNYKLKIGKHTSKQIKINPSHNLHL